MLQSKYQHSVHKVERFLLFQSFLAIVNRGFYQLESEELEQRIHTFIQKPKLNHRSIYEFSHFAPGHQFRVQCFLLLYPIDGLQDILPIASIVVYKTVLSPFLHNQNVQLSVTATTTATSKSHKTDQHPLKSLCR